MLPPSTPARRAHRWLMLIAVVATALTLQHDDAEASESKMMRELREALQVARLWPVLTVNSAYRAEVLLHEALRVPSALDRVLTLERALTEMLRRFPRDTFDFRGGRVLRRKLGGFTISQDVGLSPDSRKCTIDVKPGEFGGIGGGGSLEIAHLSTGRRGTSAREVYLWLSGDSCSGSGRDAERAYRISTGGARRARLLPWGWNARPRGDGCAGGNCRTPAR